MFRRILVPVDTSPRATEALEVARYLAERLDASLVLLRVEQPVVDLTEVIEDNQDLESQVKTLRKQGIDAHFLLQYGRPEQGIADTAEHECSDLIVMAPHARAGLDAFWHPSVTARMFSRAPAPLLIWPDASPGRVFSNFLNVAGSLVLVPLDGSEVAEQALPFAAAFAGEYSRPILLVRVETPAFLTAARPEAHPLEVEVQAEQELEALSYLRSVRWRMINAGYSNTQSMVLRGQPAAAILHVAENHNGSLLVMSTHGRGGLARLLAGSVANEVMRHTPLPLVVVPPHAAAPSRMMLAPQAHRSTKAYEPAQTGS
jgi:nucleotide-binding universal stress UspA family protein